MELDQILKRVQWMDDERRKDKDVIAMLDNRILILEGSLNAVLQQNKELSGEITRLNAVVTRMDQYDANLSQQRIETKRMLEELDKDTRKREEEAGKARRIEMKALDSNLLEISKDLEILPKLEKGIQARVEDESRLNRMIDEVRAKVEDVRRSEDEYTRTYRLLEDGRRQDAKRLTDLQGEVAALRKRVDDQRGQTELINSSLRKTETRLTELVNVEAERRDAQATFLDKQNLLQVERDRVWRDWEARFGSIEVQAADVETALQKLESIQRDTRRAQTSVEELTQRVERRTNEITEVQRLSEERFRQEWVTFKADDQKRWTNYTLIQEEMRNENLRQLDKISERVTLLEDSMQEEADLLQEMAESTEKRLQGLLSLVHDWVSTFEQAIGRTK